ncbi:hypothetical protein SASPL_109015 [Salvia splendens]|uniref:Uncharacterized protein n=1 Tax=Salvia splendens TaxID=180675 RepID=A0A8X8YE39_SALSN|nr:hypothetical protein SASPL_109015 [Salvia splendens]
MLGLLCTKTKTRILLLACFYGLDDVKKEHEVTVVLLSDRTEKISADELSCYEVNENDTEVNSPAVFPPPTVRRKLFPDEVEPPTDRESTNEAGICFIDLDADGKLHTRMMGKGRDLPTQPGRNKDPGGPSNLSSNASSCASNSPCEGFPTV